MGNKMHFRNAWQIQLIVEAFEAKPMIHQVLFFEVPLFFKQSLRGGVLTIFEKIICVPPIFPVTNLPRLA